MTMELDEQIGRARRAMRQQAETSRLLGVDFVPCFAGPPCEEERPPAEPPAQVVTEPVAASGARRDAERAESLRKMGELRARYEHEAPHKNFVTAHTNIVWGDGDVCARLMFIGEAPGADEDRTGVPFVGRAGQLLDKMIVAMGLRREDVYIANVLKTRPPNNATPTLEECRLCAPYLHEQIAIVRPEVIVTLGLPASRLVLDSSDSMGQLRGRWAEYAGPGLRGLRVPVMPTYHPAFLLRSYTPENRKKVWSDLQQVVARLAGERPH
ncbi:MAG TPA: uracil-DNA glycosylase [Phycisphaerales bacterium]|nr:uracil-DNA glycosylase [Phycisphaerales bacterium]